MRKKQFVQNDNNMAIAYYRFSSHAQNEQSIDQQRELAEEYAEAHGLTIVKEYVDEALSGRDDTRPQYQLMLSEVKTLKPAVLILWKTDRLGRDRFDLQIARRIIRGVGCSIECVAEPFIDPNDPTSIFVEGVLDAQAEYYSANLTQNVMRGLHFNAKCCYYNGVKVFGYTTEDLPIKAKGGGFKKAYTLDPVTSPVVRRIFEDYANGKPIKEIADDLNAQGLRTTKDGLFNVNGLRHILMNRMYLGEYRYGGIVVPDGVPRIISDDLFDKVQKRFELNKHKPKSQEVRHIEATEPRFWLTGKLFCGECKESMQGVSGTSKSGRIHYYYICKNHRKHKCKLRPVRKEFIEYCVIEILREFLSDQGNLASLAVDVSEYAKKMHSDDTYLKSLQAELSQANKEIRNIIDAIKQGLVSKTLQQSLSELESKQEALEDAIAVEKAKLELANNDYGIKHYFEMYAKADFEDDETRRLIFEYFVDKIYVFDDKLIIDMFYSDNHVEVGLDAFLASEEYAKESIKDMGVVFDQNEDRSTIYEKRIKEMGLVELLLLAVGLSMDAFAVSICKGIETKKANLKQVLLCGIWFGGFQGLMPFIGYVLGSRLEFIINKVAPWLAFILLSLIGINMLRESFSKEEDEARAGFDVKNMFLLAVATSIDALAVGITFVAVPVKLFNASSLFNTFFACLIICITTFLFSSLGVKIGNVFGTRYKSGAEAAGGFVLVFIGLKILLEHLGVFEFIGNGDTLFELLIPFTGTVLGSALVFITERDINEDVKKMMAGLSGGIMMACSMWTLLYPSIKGGKVLIAAVGFIIGIAFQYLLDKIVPHTHVLFNAEEGPSNTLKDSIKIMMSEVIHHVPEGMAIGVMYAGALNGSEEVSLTAAFVLTVAIAVQNIPEGAFVSTPIRFGGEEKNKSFLMGVLSGIVEPLLGILMIIIVMAFPGTLLFIMALTGGAIAFLVIEENIPSMCTGKHSDKGTITFAIFFCLMMIVTFIF